LFVGVYCSGWIGTGPRGTATTTNGGDIGKLVSQDFEAGHLESTSDRDSAINLLRERGSVIGDSSLHLFVLNTCVAAYFKHFNGRT